MATAMAALLLFNITLVHSAVLNATAIEPICRVEFPSLMATEAWAAEVPDTSFGMEITAVRVAICLVALVLFYLWLDQAAITTCQQRTISTETRYWLYRLHLLEPLGLSSTKLAKDMPLVEKQYAKHSYHNQQHAADVVGKCGAMLRRDKSKLRRKLRVGKGKRAGGISQRQFGLFQLALILAAAIHDAGHPAVGNAFLKNTQDHRFQKFGFNAERWSVHWFTIKFLKQQSFLNDLTLAEREQVVAIVSFAVLKTDMAVHASVLAMAEELQKEKDPLKRMQLLAALLLHTADLANGADLWGVSKLWARWCHQEFHAQGDTSRALLPNQPVPALNDRTQADVPRAQLNFIKTFAAPTFRALWTVAPLSAALGLAGCFINGCMCWLTIMWQTAGQKVMDVCGMGKLQRLL